MTTRPFEPINFPPFQLDLAGGRLRRGSEAIELPPKAFGVLQYLAERPGQLVGKDELLDAIWPDVHVGEQVLKVTIAGIRKALTDTFREPRFIETAHRRGYRFIARTDAPSRAELRSNAIPFSTAGMLAHSGIPKTRYARSGDVNIAYQVLGEGPLDLVFVMGWLSHLEYFWTEPAFARFLRRLASFSRLILFDKRGTGLSDRVPLEALPTLDQRMDDVRAVMDAAGSKRAAICGVSEGGAMAALFAATYPERTAALVMIGTYAKRLRDENYPWAPSVAEREQFLDEIRDHWGEPVGLAERAPSMVSNAGFRQWWATYLRMSASPGAAVALTKMNSEADIRNVLPAVRVPTVVIHRTGDKCLKVAEGRYVASRIPGARFVELPGEDHLPFVGDQDAILDEVQEFLTGARGTHRGHAVLATAAGGDVQAGPRRTRSMGQCVVTIAASCRA
jgi:pimeloyl-ACP methyl ester carboxylesterase/DNA-binding winged helix-turn-helix (wHTH) protein